MFLVATFGFISFCLTFYSQTPNNVPQEYSEIINFEKIEIDTTYIFRGLSVVDDSVAWVSGRKGIVGRSTNGGKLWKFTQVKGFEKLDFRSLYAFNSLEAIVANAGSPAHILRTKDGGENWEIIYTNKDSSAFFDGIDFWNDQQGIIYGDAIKGRMLLVQTHDAGKSWQELPKKNCPEMALGEGSFAASGTGIRCYGKEKVMICTGGKVSRLFVSKNKGNNWSVLSPPIIQGETTTGISSFSFRNDLEGIIVGGDFLKDKQKEKSIFYTKDGGKTWKEPLNSTGGERCCVEYISKNLVLCTGKSGMDCSASGGINWSPIKDQKNFYVIRKARKGKLIIATGYKRLSLLTVLLP